MSGNMGGLVFAAVLLPAVIWFIIAIVIGVWIYRDAESRGMGGTMWLIITLVLSIIGLIIYLIVRKPKTATTIPTARASTT
jgi:putative membrane protein